MFGKRPNDQNAASHPDFSGGDNPAGPHDAEPKVGPSAHAGDDFNVIDPDETAALISSLSAERDDFKDKWLRTLAEFQNSQRRALENEKEAKRQGITSVLMSVVPVLDSFDMALASAPKDGPGAAMADGVVAIQRTLIAALAQHGVNIIQPALGDEFDPNRHSAIMQQPANDANGTPLEPGRISRCLQVGYALGERVIRSAKVAVTPTL